MFRAAGVVARRGGRTGRTAPQEGCVPGRDAGRRRGKRPCGGIKYFPISAETANRKWAHGPVVACGQRP